MPIQQPKPIRQTMIYERATKNTYVYVSSDFGAAVSTLYVSRLTFHAGPPKTLTLTIQAEKE